MRRPATRSMLCRGWVAAGDPAVGDGIHALSGDAGSVTGQKREKLGQPISVYNLDVEDFHSYFVAGGVLVHNRCKKPNEDSPTFERMGKSKGNTPRNNKVQNKQFRDASRKLARKDPNNYKKLKKRMHEAIHGQGYGYQKTLKEIEKSTLR